MPVIHLNSYSFIYHSSIAPLKDFNGKLIEYNPAYRYSNKKNLRKNVFGNNTFCKFSIEKLPKGSGVYAIFIDDETKPMYIGKAANLANRWSRRNYASISPRNCYVGGQSTNCHINSEILKEYKAGHEIKLYILETDDYSKIESVLICAYDPCWNKQHP